MGYQIGGEINKGLELVNWEWIEDVGVRLATAGASFINGLAVSLDPELVGQNIANAINSGVTIARTFFDETNFDAIGEWLGTMLNKAINDVEWYNLGVLFADKWNSLIDVINGVVKKVDWVALGEGIAMAINGWFDGVDWDKLSNFISDGVQGIFDAATSAVNGITWEDIGRDISDFLKGIDWDGIFISVWEFAKSAFFAAFDLASGLADSAGYQNLKTAIEGLKKAITPTLDKLADAVNWLYNDIVKPFVNWIGDTAAPSILNNFITPLVNLANTVLDVVIPAVKNLWEKTLRPFFNDISNNFMPLPDKFGQMFNDISIGISGNSSQISTAFGWLGTPIHIVTRVASIKLEEMFSKFENVLARIGAIITNFLIICGGVIDISNGVIRELPAGLTSLPKARRLKLMKES